MKVKEGTGRVRWPKSRDVPGAEILWSYWGREMESPLCKTKGDLHLFKFNVYFELNR